eukprot:3459797-Rhodomonas_salina.1
MSLPASSIAIPEDVRRSLLSKRSSSKDVGGNANSSTVDIPAIPGRLREGNVLSRRKRWLGEPPPASPRPSCFDIQELTLKVSNAAARSPHNGVAKWPAKCFKKHEGLAHLRCK